MKILIIEDTDYKIKSICHFLETLQFPHDLKIARSFQSGLRELNEFSPQIVILDMSLPTVDESESHAESRFRVFGGRDILGEIEFEDYACKVIVLTQFDHFGPQTDSIDHITLFKDLEKRFPNIFAGGVYYNNLNSVWEQQLRGFLMQVIKNIK